MAASNTDLQYLRQACELARRGAGLVEPNPQVGCIIVKDGQIVGSGWHQEFGGPHAEVHALSAAGAQAHGSTVYVTLEPCCHDGKTPPCTSALTEAEVARVVIGAGDPNPLVSGKGIAALRAAGIEVSLVDDSACQQVIAPFALVMKQGRPWVIAKWAMTLDGKMASHTGSSQWISGERSRKEVHRLRGLVDAIVVGRGTAEQDDPSLTARPPGPRIATRIVLDSRAALSTNNRLFEDISRVPLLLACRADAPQQRTSDLETAGAEVLRLEGSTKEERVLALLSELGSRQMTNVLVEGGSGVLGSFFDAGVIDEVHAFVAPKLIGGQSALAPMAGQGLADMQSAMQLENVQIENLDGDVHVHGFVTRPNR